MSFELTDNNKKQQCCSVKTKVASVRLAENYLMEL